ncbi:unnamed protein product [Mytilus coruscus]|uniref:Uncharacterized protein n=1 Tax=Mytilus coruscus TaxID=42192 RepID=A0A6J8D4F9_MYTCO|nr:unnamed protein product [Mytilus coruscus]
MPQLEKVDILWVKRLRQVKKKFTAGLREVSNGKASTYVSCTNEIIKDIEITTKSNDKILPKVKSFMTDRSATEHKANTLLSAEIHDENNNTETHNFKCAVHPLLQFSDVCTKQIVKLEKDKTVNIDGSPILRALGLISKIFTEPYWKKAGGEIETALGMGNIYNRLVEFLEICIANPELVLTENGIKLFYGLDFPDDDIYSYLLKPCNLDYFTNDIIVKFCFELKVKCMQLFKDFMPTGKYYAPNDEILNILVCKSCPSNNISVERLMAKMDNCIVNAPTYNTNSMESVIMFKNNNTQEWLHKKTDAETTEIIANARTQNNKFLSDIKCRKKDLFHQNIETIRQRQINESNRQVKLNVELQTALDVFNRNGIWNTDSKIKEELAKINKKKDQIIALKSQLSMCKKLFPVNQTLKHLLQFSSHGKQFDVSKLSLDLLEFIQNQQIHTPSTTIIQEDIFLKPELLVGKYFIHTWTDNGQDEQWKGRIYSYDGGLFEVQYNDKDGKLNQELYELTCEEMKTDFAAVYFVFEGIMINLSTMSHDNMHETDYRNKSGE